MNKRPGGILILALLCVGYAIFMTFKMISGSFELHRVFGIVVAEKALPTLVLAIIVLAGYISVGFMRGTKSAWYAYLASSIIFSASKLVSDIAHTYAEKTFNLARRGYYREQANAIFTESLKSIAINDALIIGIVFFIANYVYRQKAYFGINGGELKLPSEFTDFGSSAKKILTSAKEGLVSTKKISMDNYKKKIYLSAATAFLGFVAAIGILLLFVPIMDALAGYIALGIAIITCFYAGYISVWQASITVTLSSFIGFFLAISWDEGFDDEKILFIFISLIIMSLGAYFGGRRMKKKIGESGLKHMFLANASLVFAVMITSLTLMFFRSN